MNFTTAYYSQFWYSKYENLTRDSFSGSFFQDEVQRHKDYLRLLSILFEKIYIPRTHLLTHAFSKQWKIGFEVFKSREFSHLLANDMLIVSSYPGIDQKQDNERILSRQSHTDKVYFAPENDYAKSVPITPIYEVDSIAESRSNTISFPDYGEQLEALNPKLAGEYMDAVKKSNIDGIPFYHELFTKHIKESFGAKNFEKIWRDTNSIYLTTGVPGDRSVIPYFNELIESTDFRCRPYGFDRLLLSPLAILTFLGLFLTDKEINSFLRGPVELSCPWVGRDYEFRGKVNSFRKAYFGIVQQLSVLTSKPNYSDNPNLLTVRNMFSLALEQSSRKWTNTTEKLSSDISAIANATGSDELGVAAMTINSGIKLSKNKLREYLIKRRHPDIVKFVQALKNNLKETL